MRLALLSRHYREDREWTGQVLADGQQRLATWRPIDKPVNQRRRIHCRDQVGRAASQQLVPEVVTEMTKSKARC